MKIGILADTHSNFELIETVVNILRDQYKVERLFHLGDDEGDSDKLVETGISTTAVPGIYDKCYPAKGDGCAHVERIGGFRVVLIHDLRDLGRLRGRKFDIVCHGHTHAPMLAVNMQKLFLNPGHLKGDEDRGNPPSFAVLEIEGDIAKAFIVDLAGSVVRDIVFNVPDEDEEAF